MRHPARNVLKPFQHAFLRRCHPSQAWNAALPPPNVYAAFGSRFLAFLIDYVLAALCVGVARGLGALGWRESQLEARSPLSRLRAGFTIRDGVLTEASDSRKARIGH